MDSIIGLKELREDVSKFERRVKRGETFIVMRRGKPLFRIVPVDSEVWETVVDFSKFKKGGVPIEKVLTALKRLKA